MKITKSQLKQTIKEELARVLNEGDSANYYGKDEDDRFNVDIFIKYSDRGDATIDWEIIQVGTQWPVPSPEKTLVTGDSNNDLQLTSLGVVVDKLSQKFMDEDNEDAAIALRDAFNSAEREFKEEELYF